MLVLDQFLPTLATQTVQHVTNIDTFDVWITATRGRGEHKVAKEGKWVGNAIDLLLGSDGYIQSR